MFSKQVVTDPGCEKWVHTSYCSPNNVREMVTGDPFGYIFGGFIL